MQQSVINDSRWPTLGVRERRVLGEPTQWTSASFPSGCLSDEVSHSLPSCTQLRLTLGHVVPKRHGWRERASGPPLKEEERRGRNGGRPKCPQQQPACPDRIIFEASFQQGDSSRIGRIRDNR